MKMGLLALNQLRPQDRTMMSKTPKTMIRIQFERPKANLTFKMDILPFPGVTLIDYFFFVCLLIAFVRL